LKKITRLYGRLRNPRKNVIPIQGIRTNQQQERNNIDWHRKKGITGPARRNGEKPSSDRRSPTLLGNPQFAEFEWENPPDGELTDGIDDESIVNRKEEAYATDEGQDVAVFTENSQSTC